MCRWLAYTGSPVLLSQVLYTLVHSLIDQSLHSRLGAETTNGDGLGVGWYDAAPAPGVFRSIEPAWNDQNLRELAGHISSHLFFAHIRAAIGRPSSRPTATRSAMVGGCSCTTGSLMASPRSSGTWCWRSTGRCSRRSRAQPIPRSCSTWPSPSGWPTIRRMPSRGHRAGGGVRAGAGGGIPVPGHHRNHRRGQPVGVPLLQPGQVTVAVLHPRRPRAAAAVSGPGDLARGVRHTRLVVSEPIGDLPGAWIEMPEASYGVVTKGGDQLLPFAPKPPSKTA